MPKYRFLEPMVSETLSDGKIRVFFNEEIKQETHTEGEGEEQQEVTETAYYYDAVDMEVDMDKGPKGFTRSELISAFIHAKYTIDDEIALDRHARAGDHQQEVADHDAYAEQCIAWADAYFAE